MDSNVTRLNMVYEMDVAIANDGSGKFMQRKQECLKQTSWVVDQFQRIPRTEQPNQFNKYLANYVAIREEFSLTRDIDRYTKEFIENL